LTPHFEQKVARVVEEKKVPATQSVQTEFW